MREDASGPAAVEPRFASTLKSLPTPDPVNTVRCAGNLHVNECDGVVNPGHVTLKRVDAVDTTPDCGTEHAKGIFF